MASSEVEHSKSHSEVAVTGWAHEPADAPSARFGWHGESKTAMRIGGWVSGIALLAMLIGNHESRVEDLYLIGFAAVLWFILLRDLYLGRRKWKN
ncbi:DUF2631 domain-containing protein [Williamsia maris]|uniref:DUF2631 domain-containing protein n=1 Tax=Williamsia maris TaxID=72806 RepID=A0ABT1HKV8_9NOCA|nr:DUF2631 domain-containing protein [Williamsia maris]MCP2178573.1 Protein of unknown function (DUF2631) [Williamsia maris]